MIATSASSQDSIKKNKVKFNNSEMRREKNRKMEQRANTGVKDGEEIEKIQTKFKNKQNKNDNYEQKMTKVIRPMQAMRNRMSYLIFLKL